MTFTPPPHFSISLSLPSMLSVWANGIILKTVWLQWWSRLLWSSDDFSFEPETIKTLKRVTSDLISEDLLWGGRNVTHWEGERLCAPELRKSFQSTVSSVCFVDFSQAWRRYDTDRSGYIEANELKVCFECVFDSHWRIKNQTNITPHLFIWLTWSCLFLFCYLSPPLPLANHIQPLIQRAPTLNYKDQTVDDSLPYPVLIFFLFKPL